MGRPKPFNPADMAIARHAPEELEPVYDVQGFETTERRRVNVFLQWRDHGATEEQKRHAKSLSAHGVALMALYAKAHGVAGGRDVSVDDYVDEGFAPSLTADWQAYFRASDRADANKTYLRIMGQVGHLSAHVLTGVCHDWFFGDGKAVDRANGRREAPWRSVIREVYHAAGRTLATHNEESMAVFEALENLRHAKW